MLVKSKKEVFEVAVRDTIIGKFRGLMFSKKPKNDGLLFFFKKESVVSLHMFFVFFSIDVVYVNKEKKIVEIKRKVKPFYPFILGPPAKYILELKDARSLEVGEKLIVNEHKP